MVDVSSISATKGDYTLYLIHLIHLTHLIPYLKMVDVSSISAINVETPRLCMSPAPTRARIASHTEMRAESHAT